LPGADVINTMNVHEPNGILLVDPNASERSRLQRELEQRGWCVWTASDAAAALRIFAERRREIGAAVVDLQLPGLQGSRVLADLARLEPALIRCAMSADLSRYTAAAFRQLSDTPLFGKPVQGELLEAAILQHHLAEPLPV
jgi:DNA-binding NtrC family response regulator